MMDRGSETAIIYPEIPTYDNRGNKVLNPDWDHPVTVRVTVATDRQSDAELPGQVSNRVLRCTTRTAPVDSWARVVLRGEYWDLAIPPTESKFTRRTAHWFFVLRSRNEQVHP